ncbi:MAG: hypothetical protein IMHGJWDQ_000199 [Candidatus Fervidibacter sp.]
MTEALAALAALTLMEIVLGRKDPSPSAESFLGRAPCLQLRLNVHGETIEVKAERQQGHAFAQQFLLHAPFGSFVLA